MHHPNIFKLKGVYIDPVKNNIVMFTELADKGNLSQVLENGDINISDEQKITWAIEIANGMVCFK